MTDTVGGIKATFTGDSTGLSKSLLDVFSKVDAAKAKFAELNAALKNASVTSNLSAEGLKALQLQADKAEQEVRQLTQAQANYASTAAGNVGKSVNSLGQVREGMEKVRGVMSSVGQVAGVAGDKFGQFGAIAQNAIGAFMTGGAAGLAMAAFSTALMLAGDKWDLFGKKAEEAAQKTKEALDKLDGEILDVKYEIIAMASGEDLSVIKQRAATDTAKKALEDAIAAAGGEQSVRMTAGLHQRGKENPLAGAEEAYTAVEAAQMILQKEQEKLAFAMQKADLAKEIAAQAKFVDEANQAEQEYQRSLKAAAKELEKTSPEERAASAIAAVSDIASSQNQAGNTMDQLKAIFAGPMSQDEASGLVGLGSAAEQTQQSLEDVNGSLKRAWEAEDKAAASHAALEAAMFQSAIVVQDTTDPFTRLKANVVGFSDGLEDATQKMFDDLGMDDLANGVKTAATSGFQGAASGVGAQLGAIVDTALGGATGGLGTIVGAILGGILGKALDELIKVLDITTPLFDAVAVIIRALTPILLVLKQLFVDIGAVLVALAPLILALAKPLAAIILVYVRLIEILLPFGSIIIVAITALVMFVDLITVGIRFLDDHFFRPLAEGVAGLYNVFVDVMNGFTNWFRDFFGDHEFGVLWEKMDEKYKSLLDTPFEVVVRPPPEDGYGGKDAVGDSDNASSSVAGGETNIPSGYKRRLNELMFGVADPESPAGGTIGQMSAITINIANWSSRGTLNEEVQKIRRYAMNGSLAAQAVSRAFNPDDRN